MAKLAMGTNLAELFSEVADAAELRARLWEFWQANTSGEGRTSVRVMLQVLGASCAARSPYAEYANAAIATFIDSLAAGLRGLPSIDDPELVATLLVSGLRGILQDRLITGEVDRTDRAARLLIEQALR